MNFQTIQKNAIRAASLAAGLQMSLAPGALASEQADYTAITAAAMSRDPGDIAAAIGALEEAIARSDAEAMYHAALLHIAYGAAPNLQLDRPADEVEEHLQSAVALINQIEEQGAMTQHTVLLRTYALFLQVMLDRSRATEMLPEIQSGIQEAAEIGDESDALIFMQTLLSMAGQMPTQEALVRVSEIAEQTAQRAQDGGDSADWWDMQAFNLLALTHTIFMGDPEEGRRWTTMGLEVRPDCRLLLDYHEPNTRRYEETDATALVGLSWQAMATDAAGDGDENAGADATEVAAAFADDGMLWFRVAIEQWPADGRIGFNLVIDADGDQETGSAWWGGTDTFTFDRIATLWVRESDDGSFYGMNGFASDASAYTMRMLDDGVGEVLFVVDRENGTLCVGLDPKRVCDLEEAPVIFAVGSNQRWGDDLTGPSDTPVLLALRK